MAAEGNVTHRFLLNPQAELSLAVQTPPIGAITVVAGPEGGFEAGEIEALETAGAVSVHLGPRTLRTETAAITALSVVQALWGTWPAHDRDKSRSVKDRVNVYAPGSASAD